MSFLKFAVPLIAPLILCQEVADVVKLLRAEPEKWTVSQIHSKTTLSRMALAAYFVATIVAIVCFASQNDVVDVYAVMLMASIPVKVGYHAILLVRLKAALPEAKVREVMDA